MNKLLFFTLFFTVAAGSAFAAASNFSYCKTEEYCVSATDCTACESSPGKNDYDLAPTTDSPKSCSTASGGTMSPSANDGIGTISQIDCTWQATP